MVIPQDEVSEDFELFQLRVFQACKACGGSGQDLEPPFGVCQTCRGIKLTVTTLFEGATMDILMAKIFEAGSKKKINELLETPLPKERIGDIANLPSGEKRDKFIELVKQSVDISAEFISPKLSPAAKYYAIIQEVVETLAEDGRFDRTIVSIRDELGSDLDRYTSLEWHMWADGEPKDQSSVLLQHKDGYIEAAMFYWIGYGNNREFLKWAYLPYTGWNNKE